jgi:adenosylcobinamide amidohydrolase
MSYFESLDETNSVLKKILILLKPLGIITGAGRNNLNVDIGSGTVTTVTTVGTVNTVSSVTNQANMGTVNAFVMAKDQARNTYANSVRNNLTF